MLPRLRLPLRGRRDIVCRHAVERVTGHLEALFRQWRAGQDGT